MKKCNKCKEIKSLNEFHKLNSGYRAICKICRIEDSKNYYENNKEYILNAAKEWAKNNPEKCKEMSKNWRNNNVEKRAKYQKEYLEKNPTKNIDYFKTNKKELQEKRRKYKKEKREKDPVFKLKDNIGKLIRITFKNIGFTKKSRTYEILGCTFEEFKNHLEKQFEPWMNWSNYGLYKSKTLNYGWDLDHIIPISSAICEEDVIKLNHYTNYQPLCSYTNRQIKRNQQLNKLL